MKLLVFSDSHRRAEPMIAAVARLRPDAAVHLGDVTGDAQALAAAFPSLTLYSVRGNCDYDRLAPEERIFEFAGRRFLAVHGHLYGVKHTSSPLVQAARERGADAALFGHTHIPLITAEAGIVLVNPGTAALTCALIEGEPEGQLSYKILDI